MTIISKFFHRQRPNKILSTRKVKPLPEISIDLFVVGKYIATTLPTRNENKCLLQLSPIEKMRRLSMPGSAKPETSKI